MFTETYNFLNDPHTAYWVQRIALDFSAGFFTLFFILMVGLKPRPLSLDFGWTWVIGSIAAVCIRTLLLVYHGIGARFGVVASVTWLSLTLAGAFTLCMFVIEHVQERHYKG